MSHLFSTTYCIRLFFIACWFLTFPFQSNAQCCQEEACKAKALQYVVSFQEITAHMPEAPEGSQQTKEYLTALKKADKDRYNQFKQLVKSYIKWVGKDGTKSRCYANQTPDLESNAFKLSREVSAYYLESRHRSSQFCRGVDFRLEAGQGVSNLAKQSEGFVASARGLVAYTFAPTDPGIINDPQQPERNCNGRVRVLAGLSETYLNRKGLFHWTLRTEIRVFPIDTKFGSLGNIKLIAQGSLGIDNDFNSFGAGAGLETRFFGFHLLFDSYPRQNISALQLNIMYPFKSRKK